MMAKSTRSTIILLFAFGITSSIKGMTSEDLQVLINDSAVISCFPNKALIVQWHHTPLGESVSKLVYAGGKFYFPYNTGRFRIDNDSTPNIYTLVITNVTQEDAGLYECQDDVFFGVFGSTQLIILNSNLVCNSNMHPDGAIGPNKCDLQIENMTFNCALSFFGKTPSLMWRSFNGSQSLINSACTTQPNHIDCSFTLKADPAYDGSLFICETKASNGARYNCITEVIKVKYFSADYENSTRKVNDNVSCIVISNLETRYNWKKEQNGQYVFLSSNKTVVMKEPGIYRCDVEYSIRNNTCSFLTSVVNASVDSTNEGSSGFPKEQGNVLIAISIVIPISLAVYAAFVIYTKCIKDDEVPLIERRRTRLDKILPRLIEICTILQIGTELIRKLKVLPAIKEGFDDADAVDANTKFARLLRIISGQMGEAFDLFKKTLVEINPALGDYIEKGEMVAVDITTELPNLDVPLSKAFNDAVNRQSDLFLELKPYEISIVVAKPSNSIEVFIYCREPKNMRKLIEIFNSGKLETLLSNVLEKLLLNVQSSNVGPLEAKVYIHQKEVTLIEQFADQNDWLQDRNKIRKSSSSFRSTVSSVETRTKSIALTSKSKKQPINSDSSGELSDTSDEDDIISPLPKKSNTENVTGITESNWKDILRTNSTDLLVQINSNSAEEGLEGEFRKLDVLNPYQIKSIWSHRSNIERNKVILSLLKDGDLKRFLAVRSALCKSGQQPVVEKHMSFIKEHLPKPDNRYDEPLKESYRYQMLINWNKLIEDISDEEGLIYLITERGTLTEYQRAVLEDLPSGTSKLIHLLRLLETGSQQHFDDFCDCLKINNQGHIVKKYLTPKSVNPDLDEIQDSFKDVKIHFNIKTNPVKGRVLVISNSCYLNQKRSEMYRNETNLNFLFQEKLVFQKKPIFDAKLVTNERAQDMMKTLETEQQSQKDYDVFLMFLFSYGNKKEIFTADGQPFKIDDLFDMFDDEKCPKLKGKPKLFIIQTFAIDDSSDSSSLDAEGKLSTSFNLKDDMALVYATVKGEPENGREVTGTLFTRCLLKVFFSKIEADFSEIIKEVLGLLHKRDQKITLPNEEVQIVQQLATFQTKLTEKVFLVEHR